MLRVVSVYSFDEKERTMRRRFDLNEYRMAAYNRMMSRQGCQTNRTARTRFGSVDDWYDDQLTDDEWVQVYGPIVDELVQEMRELDEIAESSDSRQVAIEEARDDTTRSPSPVDPLPYPSKEELAINRWDDGWDDRRTKHRWSDDTTKRPRDESATFQDDKEAIERQVQREIEMSAIENFYRVTGQLLK